MNRKLAALLATFAVAACGESTGLDRLDEETLRDMALVAADATIEDVNLWSAPFGIAPAASPASDGTVAATPGGHSGFFSFSGSRSVTFYDADGVEQDGYDPIETESIHIVHEISGEVGRDGWSATILRSRDKTVSGLAGEETTRTWNGTGAEEVSRSRHLDDGTQRSYSSVGTVDYEDVVVPIPGSDPRWPLSGTITREMTVTRVNAEGEEARSVRIVITFDGTNIALADINGEVVEIDLSTRDGRTPLRRWRKRG